MTDPEQDAMQTDAARDQSAPYEPPVVEDLDTTAGPAVTAAGVTSKPL